MRRWDGRRRGLFHRWCTRPGERGSAQPRGIESPAAALTCVDDVDYEQAVALYHEDLPRFALSLARNPDDACDLTQESYGPLQQERPATTAPK